MNILMIGNYLPLQQLSMQKFVDLFTEESVLTSGVNLKIIRARCVLGGLMKGSALNKWLQYIDQYILFVPELIRAARQAHLVHIADHSNSIYLLALSRDIKKFVTCHDVLAIRSARGDFSETSTGITGRVLQWMILAGLKRADMVACDTTATSNDLVSLAPEFSSRIAVIAIPLNFDYSPMGREEARVRLAAVHDVDRSFFLHVGGNQWYKNRAGAIGVFNELRNSVYPNHLLLMVGKKLPERLHEIIRDRELQGSVVELSSVTDEELRALYSTATALIFPSLAEGFGWPILEAQACECLVITSNRQPMIDVSGGAAIFVDPTSFKHSVASIVDGMLDARQLIAAGSRNLTRFSKQQFFSSYLQAYIRVRGSDDER